MAPKEEISLTISKEAKMMLRKMAEFEKRSQSNLFESMIRDRFRLFGLISSGKYDSSDEIGYTGAKFRPAEEAYDEGTTIEELRQFSNFSEDVLNQAKNDETRRDVLGKIFGWVEEGFTFEQVAKVLNEEKIPTFSQKGKWHRQTVHKLFRKHDKEAIIADSKLEFDAGAGFDPLIKIHRERAEVLAKMKKAYNEKDAKTIAEYLLKYLGVSK